MEVNDMTLPQDSDALSPSPEILSPNSSGGGQPQPPPAQQHNSGAGQGSQQPRPARDLAYQRRRERNNEAARQSRLNRKAKHEAVRKALACLQAIAPLARLRRIQTEVEVRGQCAAAGQDYDAVLAAAVAQLGVPADYFAAVVACASGCGTGDNGATAAWDLQHQQVEGKFR